jgi:hypothetical protein
MLRTDLQGSLGSMRCKKFVTVMAVINREHVTAIEFARCVVDPVGCREVYFGLVTGGPHGQFPQMLAQLLIGNRLVEECESVAVESNKFFQPCAFRLGAKPPPTLQDDQVHRHGVESSLEK